MFLHSPARMSFKSDSCTRQSRDVHEDTRCSCEYTTVTQGRRRTVVKKHIRHSHRKKAPRWKKLSAEHSHHRHVGHLTPNPETLELQKNGNFKEDETTDSIFLWVREKGHYWYYILWMWCENKRALQMIKKEKHEQRHRTASQRCG